jgi:uncharacterized DUF497 family protein
MSFKDNKIKLTWDGWSIEHIKKHGVNISEVREVCKSKIVAKPTYLDRKVIYGMTKKKRILTIVLSYEKQKEGYIVSARDISSKEGKIYDYEKTKTSKTI